MSEHSSDSDSIHSDIQYDDTLEEEKLMTVREAIRSWKLRELEKNTRQDQTTKGLNPLRKYVANSARLFYDLQNYMATEKNKEKNMNDSLYVAIVQAIGSPEGLSFHFRALLQRMLERDLLELPFTVEPSIVDTFTQKGLTVDTNFPDEE